RRRRASPTPRRSCDPPSWHVVASPPLDSVDRTVSSLRSACPNVTAVSGCRLHVDMAAAGRGGSRTPTMIGRGRFLSGAGALALAGTILPAEAATTGKPERTKLKV